jgi:ribose 5-phosphate isomerase B
VKKYIEKTNGDTVKGFAIIFGGSGTGEAIVANRVRGARAVVYNGNSPEIVRLGREHNDTNILSIGTRFVTEKECLEAIKIFMTTSFEGGKHAKRVLKIDMIQ